MKALLHAYCDKCHTSHTHDISCPKCVHTSIEDVVNALQETDDIEAHIHILREIGDTVSAAIKRLEAIGEARIMAQSST